MAFVCIDVSSNVVGVFSVPQNAPAPTGYAVIGDGDPRIATFIAAEQTP